MIPRINSYAATSYPATTSFTYNYDGYDYQFYFSGLVDSPQDYRFDSSVCDYVIQKASEGINLSLSSGIGAKINYILSSFASSVFDFYRNFMIATDKVIADWIVWTDIYGFSFEFTGLDTDYPGYETYGDAFGWRFTGWMGEKIDLVLDSQGMLYGSNPIGNYTFSDDQLDLGRWSIHQYEAQGGEFWAPSVSLSSFGDLKEPYISGTELHFFITLNSVEHHFVLNDFRNLNIGIKNNGGPLYELFFYPTLYGQTVNLNDFVLYDNGSPVTLHISSIPVDNWRGMPNVASTRNVDSLNYYYLDTPSFNLPGCFYNGRRYSINNILGVLNGQNVSGFGDIYLNSFTTSPLPDPIVLPVDDPIPISDIQPDPTDFVPDPDDDPDPVPGIDYPVPGPVPIPVPPVPPIVSGNDDIWPDINLVFDIEADLDGYLGNLRSFQFTPLRTLVEGFTSSIVWVSSIMMLLYDGSDFSILFVVLSVFFIAAALLGIYKWWTH